MTVTLRIYSSVSRISYSDAMKLTTGRMYQLQGKLLPYYQQLAKRKEDLMAESRRVFQGAPYPVASKRLETIIEEVSRINKKQRSMLPNLTRHDIHSLRTTKD